MSKNIEQELLHFKPDARYVYCSHPVYNHFGERVDKDEARTKLGLPKNQKILLFFGFIRTYKGLNNLLEAMKYLGPEYTLVIAGEAYTKLSIEQERVITFLRYIPDDQVKYFFSASDACVLPYIQGTQSGIAQIARHFGLPVLGTPCLEQTDAILGDTPDEMAQDIAKFFKTGHKTQPETMTWGSFAKTILPKSID